MIKDGLRITEFHREQRNLEDAFIDIIGRLDSGKPPLPPPLPSGTSNIELPTLDVEAKRTVGKWRPWRARVA